eukprot:gnl/Dysnectes_brevis/3713_a4756_1190.p1 GENE.gnl/Dysnectes_brevis/3713_a4756_1190~~gnl/Dysnectes_brevis/3713_a4756_1190.p1  ORF type:complete len:166 (+),score=13.63 gnl/Dysnectes_brevis/3713_a4756_1190:88-585(+)
MDHPKVRRKDRELTSWSDIVSILKSQNIMSLAMCLADTPYLLTVNYALEQREDFKPRFYFHAAKSGYKMEFLKASNPVFGQIRVDLGYEDHKITHRYQSVNFRGVVTPVEDVEDKVRALGLLVDQMDSTPEEVKTKFIVPERVKRTAVFYIDAFDITAKANYGHK